MLKTHKLSLMSPTHFARFVRDTGIILSPYLINHKTLLNIHLYIFYNNYPQITYIHRSQLSSTDLVGSKMVNIEIKFNLLGHRKHCLSLFSVFPYFKYLNQSSFVEQNAQALKLKFSIYWPLDSHFAINIFVQLLNKLSI